MTISIALQATFNVLNGVSDSKPLIAVILLEQPKIAVNLRVTTSTPAVMSQPSNGLNSITNKIPI